MLDTLLCVVTGVCAAMAMVLAFKFEAVRESRQLQGYMVVMATGFGLLCAATVAVLVIILRRWFDI